MTGLAPLYRRIAVFAPSASTTGGPELLHQLVHQIRVLGGEAAIHYVPDAGAAVPEPYRVYAPPVLTAEEVRQADCIVAPETLVRRLPLWPRAERFIWWLSFDNFQSGHRSGVGRLLAEAYKTGLVHYLTLSGVRHLFQSHYARSRLRERGIDGEMLSDYVTLAVHDDDERRRTDLILYNPKKGHEITERLKRRHPNLVFQPIVDMTRAEVEAAFQRAKLYIDFGEHPGKDRLPREAALMGAVVVVGIRGAAANDRDVGLPGNYKLAIQDGLPHGFGPLVEDVFRNFSTHRDAQRAYRDAIAAERDVFAQQVTNVFFAASGPRLA